MYYNTTCKYLDSFCFLRQPKVRCFIVQREVRLLYITICFILQFVFYVNFIFHWYILQFVLYYNLTYITTWLGLCTLLYYITTR